MGAININVWTIDVRTIDMRTVDIQVGCSRANFTLSVSNRPADNSKSEEQSKSEKGQCKQTSQEPSPFTAKELIILL